MRLQISESLHLTYGCYAAFISSQCMLVEGTMTVELNKQNVLVKLTHRGGDFPSKANVYIRTYDDKRYLLVDCSAVLVATGDDINQDMVFEHINPVVESIVWEKRNEINHFMLSEYAKFIDKLSSGNTYLSKDLKDAISLLAEQPANWYLSREEEDGETG